MSKTYKLPEWLGGRECTLVDVDRDGATINVEADGGGTRTITGIWVRDLIEIETPEPDNGSPWTDGAIVWIRIDEETDPIGRWWGTGEHNYLRWHQIANRAELRRLVTVDDHWIIPKTPPVDYERSLKLVDIEGALRIVERRPIGDLSPVEAYGIACAYLAAATEATRRAKDAQP